MSTQNKLLESENFLMLRHIIKSKRLKILMKFYKKMHKDHDFKWILEYEGGITDSMQGEPIVMALNHKGDSENPDGLACYITYNITMCNYIVNWYLFTKDAQHEEFKESISTPRFIDVINNIEKHLNPSHDPDIEFMDEIHCRV